MVTREHHVALVDQLVESSTPVRRIWPVRLRMTACLAGGSAAGLLVAIAWPRPDLSVRLHDGAYVLQLAMLSVATIFMTLMALRCAVPGRAPTRLETTIAVALLLGATGVLATQPTASGADDWLCSLRTLAAAIVPWTMLLITIRRGAPLRVGRAALYAGAAALLFATTLLRVACPIDGPRHWLTWHLAIVPIVTVLTMPFTTRWLRGWRHA
jgi:hypothetical protein